MKTITKESEISNLKSKIWKDKLTKNNLSMTPWKQTQP